MKCDHIVGWCTEYGSGNFPVHLGSKFEMGHLMENHGTRFDFCPLCSMKIDWKNIDTLIKLKEL